MDLYRCLESVVEYAYLRDLITFSSLPIPGKNINGVFVNVPGYGKDDPHTALRLAVDPNICENVFDLRRKYSDVEIIHLVTDIIWEGRESPFLSRIDNQISKRMEDGPYTDHINKINAHFRNLERGIDTNSKEVNRYEESIRRGIQSEIDNALDNVIFPTMQRALGIESGDISPELTLRLDEAKEYLANVVYDVLEGQIPDISEGL